MGFITSKGEDNNVTPKAVQRVRKEGRKEEKRRNAPSVDTVPTKLVPPFIFFCLHALTNNAAPY